MHTLPEPIADPRLLVRERYSCQHEKSIIVKYQQAHGQWRIRKQCLSCGEYCSSDLKMSGYDLETIPVADFSLRDQRRGKYRAEYDDATKDYYEQRQMAITPRSVIEDWDTDDLDTDENFWDQYSVYLRSRGWHKMRQLVIKRDGNLCQACLNNKATQVHHLSYRLFKKLGKSAAFELVAICNQCHEKIHPRMADAQRNQEFRNPYLEVA
jgi:hypothetical protein